MMTSAKSETREENTPEKRLLDVDLHTFKLQSYNMTARKSTTKPQTALTNPKVAAEALVVVGVVTGAISASLAPSTAVSIIDSNFCQHYCMPQLLQIYRHRSVIAPRTRTQTLQGVIATNGVFSLWAVKVHFPEKSRERHLFFVVFCWNSILEPNLCSIYIPVSFFSRSDTNSHDYPLPHTTLQF